MRVGRGELRIRGHTVGQRPNAPLWTAIVALAIALVSGGSGVVADVSRAVFYLAVAIWAYEELVRGVNRFRRSLGAVALLVVLIGLSRAIS